MTAAFAHGFLLALGLILPLGPQNMFIFTRGTTETSLLRLAPVIAVAALCDSLLIVLAVLGISVVVITLPWVRMSLIVGGVVFLLIMAIITWRSAPAQSQEGDVSGAGRWSLRRQFVFTMSVSLLNPHAILDTVAVLGTSALAYTGSARVGFTLACLLVSWLWFTLLAAGGRLAGTYRPLRRVLNRVSALAMGASALYLASTLRV